MNSLFSKYKLWDFIENWKKETVEYVSNLSPQDVIGVDQELLIQEIVTERRKQGIALDESHIECLEPIEVQIEVDRNPNLAFHNIFDPHFIKGTSVSFLIPFDGDYRFFETMPSTRNLCPPRGIIHKNQLEIVFQGDDLNPDIIDQQFQQTLSNIKEYLSWINLDLTGYNKALPLLIRPVLMQRIDKIQKDTVLISIRLHAVRRCEERQRGLLQHHRRNAVRSEWFRACHAGKGCSRHFGRPEPRPIRHGCACGDIPRLRFGQALRRIRQRSARLAVTTNHKHIPRLITSSMAVRRNTLYSIHTKQKMPTKKQMWCYTQKSILLCDIYLFSLCFLSLRPCFLEKQGYNVV